jgi:hypothetical protein
MLKFKDYLLMREGGFVADDKAEEGKSKPNKPQVRGPSSVTVSGVAGGPGGAGGGGGGAAPAAPATPSR